MAMLVSGSVFRDIYFNECTVHKLFFFGGEQEPNTSGVTFSFSQNFTVTSTMCSNKAIGNVQNLLAGRSAPCPNFIEKIVSKTLLEPLAFVLVAFLAEMFPFSFAM